MAASQAQEMLTIDAAARASEEERVVLRLPENARAPKPTRRDARSAKTKRQRRQEMAEHPVEWRATKGNWRRRPAGVAARRAELEDEGAFVKKHAAAGRRDGAHGRRDGLHRDRQQLRGEIRTPKRTRAQQG